MNNIWEVVKKELKDILRDRKTLVMTFLLPIFIIPLLFTFMFSNMDTMIPSETNQYNIAINSNDRNVLDIFTNNPTLHIVEDSGQEAIDNAYEGNTLVYVEVDSQFHEKLTNNEIPSIHLYYDTTSQRAQTAVEIIESTLSSYQLSYVSQILQENGLPEQMLHPFNYVIHARDESVDSASAMILGMLIPLMLIGYSASGILPIVTDLGAGEKERGTLEPLLSTSVSRNSILVGKLIVVTTFCIITCILSAAGLLLSFHFGLQDMNFILGISTVNNGIILGISILYSIFISAVLLMISTYARTIKEANTYLTPFILIPMLLSFITMYMDVNSIHHSFLHVPILNVVIIIKSIVVNQLHYTHLYITVAWSIIYIIIAMFIARKMYDMEEIIFRT